MTTSPDLTYFEQVMLLKLHDWSFPVYSYESPTIFIPDSLRYWAIMTAEVKEIDLSIQNFPEFRELSVNSLQF